MYDGYSYDISQYARSLEDLESYGEIGERPVISLNYSYLDTLDKHQRINN